MRNTARFLSLGAVTAASATTSVVGFRAFYEQPEAVPEVDALASSPPGGGEWPLVSVVVPARNEQRNLPRLLSSLLSQRYPRYELIVVDDQSTDDTPRILAEWASRDRRLKVVRGKDLPQGWLGKPYAMYQGAQHAQGEWLLFTDADTEHEPCALSSSIAYAMANRIDLLTILPCPELHTVAEKVVMPVAFQGISGLFPAHRVNDPRDKTAIANGQYILIRRQVYEAVGGIERVKDRIAEDMEFAKVVKGAGYRLRLADGRHLMRVRMYTNLAEIWEGWSKNAILAFEDRPGVVALMVVGTFALVSAPAMLALWAVGLWRRSVHTGRRADRLAAMWASALAVWNLVLPLVYRRRVDGMMGLSPVWSLTHPVGMLIMGLIMLYTLARLALGRGVTWKGRVYAARG
jgi:chlorobactene glucosyltransferase